MNEISLRIKKLITHLGMSDAAFAKSIDVPQTTFSNMFLRDSEPKPSWLHSIVNKYYVSADWLLTGEGNMFNEPETPAVPATEKRIPLLGQKVSCGPGQSWDSEDNIIEYIDISELSPRMPAKDVYAFRASGTSMLGAGIKDGDIVLFSASEGQSLQDGIYVFGLDGEAYCKRLEFDPIAQRIKIYSVRVADLEKAELLTVLSASDPGYAERFQLFGRVFSWIHVINSYM